MAERAPGRSVRFLLIAAVAAALAAGASHVPDALARVEAFQVRAVVVEGDRFLDRQDVLAAVAIPPGASVWDDFRPWETRLERHPLVADARVTRRLPDTLVLSVQEREPVALLPDPTLEFVDVEGRTLPLDPADHALDLPLLEERPRIEGAAPSRLRVRLLAQEVGRLQSADPDFLDGLSQLGWDENGDMVALWGDPVTPVRFRAPLGPRRVREALQVLADASARFPARKYEVDLRWDDQVVVRFK